MDHEPNGAKRAIILINACVSTFMGTLDGSIVNIALPSMAGSFGVGISAVQWVTTAYLIAVSALLLLWGRLSDIHGRKRFFVAGLAIFTAGSLLCGLSGSLAALVASRVLQAIGASMTMALTQGIVTAAYPPAERGKALGFIGAVVALGSLMGPSLGGLLVQTAGWRSIFFINIPIGILGVVLTLAVMPESRGAPGARFDRPGAALFALAIASFFTGALALQQAILPAWASLSAMALGAALFLLFLRAERSPDPLIDGSIFRSRVFTVGIIVATLSFISMFCYTFFMPFFLQDAKGLSALGAGALMSIYPLLTGILSPFAGALSDRITYRPLTLAGLLLTAAGMALLASFGPATPLWAIGADIALLGVGGAAFQSPNNSSVMGSVPRHRLGIAGSLNSFFRNLGMVSGTTLAVSLFALSTRARVDDVSAGAMPPALFTRGFRVVVLSAAALSLAGALIELFGRADRIDAASRGEESAPKLL